MAPRINNVVRTEHPTSGLRAQSSRGLWPGLSEGSHCGAQKLPSACPALQLALGRVLARRQQRVSGPASPFPPRFHWHPMVAKAVAVRGLLYRWGR